MDKPDRLMPKRETMQMAGFGSNSSFYEAIKRGDFPKPIKISIRRSAWSFNETQAWIRERTGSRRSAK